MNAGEQPAAGVAMSGVRLFQDELKKMHDELVHSTSVLVKTLEVSIEQLTEQVADADEVLETGGIAALLPNLDLSGIETIRDILRDLPSKIRTDPRNACYFDQLDTILAALSE